MKPEQPSAGAWQRVTQLLFRTPQIWEPIFLGMGILALLTLDLTPGWGLVWVGSHLFMYLGMSIGLHRYFSHRSFQTSRSVQAVLAVWSSCILQGGPLFWASVHRAHHRHCETDDDPHSPSPFTLRGFYHAHFGWLGAPGILLRWQDEGAVRDLKAYPELVWIQKHNHFFALGYLLLWVAVGGVTGAAFGWLLPRLTSFHCTGLINSINHMFGYVPEGREPCHAGNVWWTLPFQLGENWHANHHDAPGRSSRGSRWWEIDPIHWLIVLVERTGLIWDVRR